MADENCFTITVTHSFRASADQVFDAFIDPAKVAKFLFVTPTGTIVRCDWDARVGGKFLVTDRRGDEEIAHEGEFIELQRPNKIVFVVRVPKYSSDSGRVSIDIQPTGTGCDVTLSETMSTAWEQHRGNIEKGWKGILLGWSQVVESP